MNAREAATLAVKVIANAGGKRAEAVRYVAFRLAARYTDVLEVQAGGHRLFVSTGDQVIGRTLFMRGELDQQMTLDAFGELERLGARLGEHALVEIGANIGTSTLSALLDFGVSSVIAFEPAPQNLRLLELNLVANGVRDRVDIHRLGLSDIEGTSALALSSANSGDHRIVRNPGEADDPAVDTSPRATIDVAVRTWDALAALGTLDLDRISAVWIDAQGHEGHILSGATQLIGSPVPIVLEFWPHALRRAGGLTRLLDIVCGSYEEVIDLRSQERAAAPQRIPSHRLWALAETLAGPARHTDLVLVPPTSRPVSD